MAGPFTSVDDTIDDVIRDPESLYDDQHDGRDTPCKQPSPSASQPTASNAVLPASELRQEMPEHTPLSPTASAAETLSAGQPAAAKTVDERPFLSRFPRSRAGEPLRCDDALVAAVGPEKNYFVTTPNMTFIPVPVYGNIEVVRRRDGHFGVHDPIHWPQGIVNTSQMVWLVAVPRKPTDALDPRLEMWTPLDTQDIIPKPAPDDNICSISTRRLNALRPVVRAMSDRAHNFLQNVGNNLDLAGLVANLDTFLEVFGALSTARDHVLILAAVQRYWMLVDAWIEFHVHITHQYVFKDPMLRVRPTNLRSDVMGGFTTARAVLARLFAWGVPVWFIRDASQFTMQEVVSEVVGLSYPDHLETDLLTRKPIYEGWAGHNHIFAISSAAARGVDHDSYGLLMDPSLAHGNTLAAAPPSSSNVADSDPAPSPDVPKRYQPYRIPPDRDHKSRGHR